MRDVGVCRLSDKACTSDRWKDSRHDFHSRHCPSGGGAAKWGSEETERVH